MALKFPVSGVQGNRFVVAAKVTFGTGGLPTGTPAGFPGLSVARGQTGIYTMAYPPLRDITSNYGVQQSTGVGFVAGFQLSPKPSGAATGIGAFRTLGPGGAVVDPGNGDVLTLWFYASESDAT